MLENPWFWSVAIPAVIVTGLAKGGFGVGLGIVAVPLMSLVMPPYQAAGILLPVLCVMDISSIWAYRKSWNGRILVVALPSAMVGITFGALTFRYFEEDHLRLIIGVVAVMFALQKWLLVSPRNKAANIPKVKGIFWSTISGFTSFVAHSGGPPFSIFMLPLRLDKSLLVGTSAIYFGVVNYVKLVPYAWLGQLHTDNLLASLLLGPLAPLSVVLGVYLHRRMSADLFYRIAYLFVFLAGVKLIYQGLNLGQYFG